MPRCFCRCICPWPRRFGTSRACICTALDAATAAACCRMVLGCSCRRAAPRAGAAAAGGPGLGFGRHTHQPQLPLICGRGRVGSVSRCGGKRWQAWNGASCSCRRQVGWRQAAAAAHPSAAWRWPSCGRAAVAPTPCQLPWSSGPAPSSGNPPAGRPPAPPAAPGNPAQLGWLQINQIMLHIEMAACRERRLACKAHLRRVQRLLKRADRHFDAINDCRAGDRAAWSRKLACMAQCAEWLL